MDVRNMVTSRQLATEQAVEITPLPLVSNRCLAAWYAIGSPARIKAKLRAYLEALAPVGYEDDSGFHYGENDSDWFFTI